MTLKLKNRTPAKKTAHCTWCGKDAAVTAKGGLAPHRTAGNQPCVGTGQPFRQSTAITHATKPRN